MARRRHARTHGRVDDARRPRPRHQPHQARHAGLQRHLPATRPARDHGRAGRPDVGRTRGTGHRRRVVRGGAHRVRDPVPEAGGAVRRASPSSCGSSPACGRPNPATGSPSTASTTRSATRPGCRSRCNGPAPPVILGGAGATKTPALAARVRDGDEHAVRRHGRGGAAVRARRRPARRGDRPALIRSAALTVCVGRDDAELRRRADAIGHDLDALRANGLAGTPAEVVDTIGRWREKTGISRVVPAADGSVRCGPGGADRRRRGPAGVRALNAAFETFSVPNAAFSAVAGRT